MTHTWYCPDCRTTSQPQSSPAEAAQLKADHQRRFCRPAPTSGSRQRRGPV